MEDFKTIPYTYPQLTDILVEQYLTMGKYILTHEELTEGHKKCLGNEIENLKTLAFEWRKGKVSESKINQALLACKFHHKLLCNIIKKRRK